MKIRFSHLISTLLSTFVYLTGSCAKGEYDGVQIVLDSIDTVSVILYPDQLDPYGELSIAQYASLDFLHQSAAAYGDYAFFIKNGRSAICMFNLRNGAKVYTCSLKAEEESLYHCNQSTFGIEKYSPSDPFPLLYISQRAKSANRCFVEVFRIIPLLVDDMSEYQSFSLELIQEIYLPSMTKENSLGNANCVIDPKTGKMYVYSRNNNSKDSNYEQCKISQFDIPSIYEKEVYLMDSDIVSSFMIDTKATYMQGGCIVNDYLFIGQGYPAANSLLLNIIDLHQQKLVKQIDLRKNGVSWEPEGCFYFDNCVMLSSMGAIFRVICFR